MDRIFSTEVKYKLLVLIDSKPTLNFIYVDLPHESGDLVYSLLDARLL